MRVLNDITANDPFANEALDFGDEVKSEKKKKETADSVQDNYIHIRVQQRNGRKSWTTVQVRSRSPRAVVSERDTVRGILVYRRER